MRILMQIAAIVYMFAVYPILLGLLWSKVTKKEFTCAEVFSKGYLTLTALFMLVAFPAIKVQMNLETISAVWLVIVAVTSCVALFLCREGGKIWWKNLKQFYQNSTTLTKAVICAFIFLMLFSIFCVKPHTEDDTIAIVETAIVRDSMYGYHPYTGVAYEVLPTENIYAPIEMLYVVISNITGIAPAFLIQFLMPIFLQTWFCTVYWHVGSKLLEDEQKNAIFMALILILHLSPLYMQGQSLAAGVFQNVWNGQTLLCCCVLPEMFLWGFMLKKRVWNDCGWKISEILKEISALIAIMLSAQLLYIRGIYYISIMLVLWIVVILIQKGCQRYGTASENY